VAATVDGEGVLLILKSGGDEEDDVLGVGSLVLDLFLFLGGFLFDDDLPLRLRRVQDDVVLVRGGVVAGKFGFSNTPC